MRSSRLSRFAGATPYTRHLLARVAPTAAASVPTGPLKSGDMGSLPPNANQSSTPPSRVVTSWFTWTPSETQEVELELAKRRKADERQKKASGGADRDSKDGTSASDTTSTNKKDTTKSSSSDNNGGSKDAKGPSTTNKEGANPRDGESSSSDVKDSISDAKTAAAAASTSSSSKSSTTSKSDGATTTSTNPNSSSSSSSIMKGTGELKGSPTMLGLKRPEASKSKNPSTPKDAAVTTASSTSPDTTVTSVKEDGTTSSDNNTTSASQPPKGTKGSKAVDEEATWLEDAKEKALYDRAFSNIRLKSYLQNHWPSSTLTELLRKNEQILRRQRDSQIQRKQEKVTAAASSTTTTTTPSSSTQPSSTPISSSIVYPSDVSYFEEGVLQAATTPSATTPTDSTDPATQQRDESAIATEVCDILEEEEEELKVELSSGLSSLGEIPLVPNSIYYRSHPKEAAAIHRSHHTPRRYQHARNEDDDNGSGLQSIPSESDKKVLEGLEKREMVPIPPKLIIRMMKKRALSAEQLKECRRQLEERMVAAGVQVGQQQQLQFPKNPKGISGARGSSIPSLKTIVDLELPEAAPFEWIDIQSHPAATLQEYRTSIVTLLLGLQVHETLIQSTMEAVILPQFSLVDGCHCLVLRSAVEDTTTFEMDSIQELTNRLTILVFKSTGRVVTIHRAPMQFLEDIVSVWVEEYAEGASASKLLSLLTKEAVRTYHKAISSSIVQFDGYEARLFVPQRQRATLAREIYHIKRRASVYSRTLALLQEAYTTTAASLNVQSFDAYLQDVQQDIVHVRSLSDELSDNANTVLQLLFQLSSYQLNELMRVLTMFSAFFIPLSFIASVYGMNFEDLPMIESEWGPMFCFALMAVVSTTIATWFKIKGFW